MMEIERRSHCELTHPLNHQDHHHQVQPCILSMCSRACYGPCWVRYPHTCHGTSQSTCHNQCKTCREHISSTQKVETLNFSSRRVVKFGANKGSSKSAVPGGIVRPLAHAVQSVLVLLIVRVLDVTDQTLVVLQHCLTLHITLRKLINIICF